MNQKTKNSTIVLVSILLAVTVFTLWFFTQTKKPVEEVQHSAPQIITTEISGELFTGSYPVVQGSDALANLVNTYTKQIVTEFKESADRDIPALREEFGADAPSANYSLMITPEYHNGVDTQSIVLEVYAYTGGANGNTTYETFTVDSEGKQLFLSDIVRVAARDVFVQKVKDTILAWRVEGEEQSLVFAEDVENLTFDSLDKFALTTDGIIIYFDKYDIAPGYVGAPSFTLQFSDIEEYLEERV